MAICTFFCVATLRSKKPESLNSDFHDPDAYDCRGGMIGATLLVLLFWLMVGAVVL